MRIYFEEQIQNIIGERRIKNPKYHVSKMKQVIEFFNRFLENR